jgi:hypothetical protein
MLCAQFHHDVARSDDDPGPRCGHTLTCVPADGGGQRLIVFGGATALEGDGPNGSTSGIRESSRAACPQRPAPREISRARLLATPRDLARLGRTRARFPSRAPARCSTPRVSRVHPPRASPLSLARPLRAAPSQRTRPPHVLTSRTSSIRPSSLITQASPARRPTCTPSTCDPGLGPRSKPRARARPLARRTPRRRSAT